MLAIAAQLLRGSAAKFEPNFHPSLRSGAAQGPLKHICWSFEKQQLRICNAEVTILLQPIEIQDVEAVCLEDLLH